MPRNPFAVVGGLPRAAARLPKMAPDMSLLPAGKMVTLADDVVTRLYDTGEEHLTPVVLLHGMAATGMLNWYQTFQRLRGEYRLIAFDQRWHGRGFKGDFTFQALTDDVLRVVDHLELPAPVLGGYSMGSLVSQLAARRDPSRFSGLVLAAAGTGAQRNAMEKLTMGWFLRTSPFLNAVPMEVAGELEGSGVDGRGVGGNRVITHDGGAAEFASAQRWALHELSSVSFATHRTVIAEVARFNSTPWLAELDLPVAVIKTMRDVAFPRRVQDEMADLLPHSAVFPIDAGHAVCATHPGTFARRMRTSIDWVVSSAG
ncbi:alpha/beta hydrolase [Rhodococcus sp. IEGM 1408]|uniref:alpha/beta fold hydrolase n=1 Tax=Rhodococcus sp. IEGM 1408 TaxID=3082220 RepID=UPI002953F73C|nr:alpha/beta hydrolase [Rhodococcus sp. IEGM 1408]MDV7999754.1 alpha/beta hydrolase [Rhodococcus sp. IEGM 1408]